MVSIPFVAVNLYTYYQLHFKEIISTINCNVAAISIKHFAATCTHLVAIDLFNDFRIIMPIRHVTAGFPCQEIGLA